MASMESMLRSINRQLEAHARIFGTDSETYKAFVLSIERIMGKANYTQRNGAVGYSRAIPMQYKYEDVQKANEAVKGKNTAARKWSDLYNETRQYDIPDKDIKRYIRLKEEVDKNQEAIYGYIKEEMRDNFYGSEYERGYHDSFFSDKSALYHTMKTTEYNSLEEIERLIKKAKSRTAEMNEYIEKQAAKTRGGKMTKREAEQLKKRFNAFYKRGKK